MMGVADVEDGRKLEDATQILADIQTLIEECHCVVLLRIASLTLMNTEPLFLEIIMISILRIQGRRRFKIIGKSKENRIFQFDSV